MQQGLWSTTIETDNWNGQSNEQCISSSLEAAREVVRSRFGNIPSTYRDFEGNTLVKETWFYGIGITISVSRTASTLCSTT